MKSTATRVAIVTGAAQPDGMGYATCLKFIEAGVKVVVTDLVRDEQSQARLHARVGELIAAGGEAIAVAVDVTSRDQITACVKETLATYGRIDCLFNNAGTPVGVGDFLTMDDSKWDMSYQINLKGIVNFCQAVLPIQIEQGRGTIINNASLAGLGAIPNMAAYSATKFAVVGLTKALAAEFGPQGIRINAVCPGMVWTQMGKTEVEHEQRPGESFADAKQRLANAELVPLERWAAASEVADAVVYLSSDKASYISGVALPVAGGMAPGL